MTQRCLSLCLGLVLGMTLLPAAANAQQAQFYVLDGFGGVHAGGGAPSITPGTPYFGFDVARDFAYIPGVTADGYLVVDGFGGVHEGGAVAGVTPKPPYFGFDIARAIALGADFVLLGRAFMYGVAALGKRGGDHATAVLTADLKNNMMQLGCATLGELPDRLA